MIIRFGPRVCAVSVCHSACDTRNRDRQTAAPMAYGYRGPPWTTYALCLPHSRLWLWAWAGLGNSQQSAALQAPLPLTSAQWHVKCESGSAHSTVPPPSLLRPPLAPRGARGRIEDWRVAKPWWRKRGWSTQGGLLSGVFRAAQRPTGAPGGLAAAWSPVEMVRLQPAPEARAAPPYPRPAASGELPRKDHPRFRHHGFATSNPLFCLGRLGPFITRSSTNNGLLACRRKTSPTQRERPCRLSRLAAPPCGVTTMCSHTACRSSSPG